MGQIVGGAAKPKRCNLNKLSQLGTPAAGEHILVSSDNSMNAAGQGNFDCYIVGDGSTIATELELKSLVDDGAFDISAYRATGNVLAKYVDLSAALDGGNNIPEAFRKGGISVKFVQSSDNKYVQYFLKKNAWSVSEADWVNMVLDEEVSQLSQKADGLFNGVTGVFSKDGLLAYQDFYVGTIPQGTKIVNNSSIAIIVAEDNNLTNRQDIRARSSVIANSNKSLFRTAQNGGNVLLSFILPINILIDGLGCVNKGAITNAATHIGYYVEEDNAPTYHHVSSDMFISPIPIGTIVKNNGVKVGLLGQDSARKDLLNGQSWVTTFEVTDIRALEVSGNIRLEIDTRNKLLDDVDIDGNNIQLDSIDINRLSFVKTGTNIYDKDSDSGFEEGKYLSQWGSLSSSSDYNTSGFIKVEPNTAYSYIPDSTWRFVLEFNENGDAISSTYVQSVRTITTSANTRYIRLTFYANSGKYFLCAGSEPKPYEDYKIFIPSKYVENDENALPFFLPKHIYVANGRTIEIYYNQILLNADRYNIQATCPIGKALERKFQIIGDASHVGNTYTLSIVAYNDLGDVIVSGSSTIHIVANTISANKKILPVGDSLTNGKPWLSELHTLSANLSTIGTRQGIHEGRSGANVSTYTNVGGGIVYDYDNEYSDNTVPIFDPSESYNPGNKVRIAHTFGNGSSGYRYWVFKQAHSPGAFIESEAYCYSGGNPFYDYVNGKFSMTFYQNFFGISYDAILLFLGTNGINLEPETNPNGALGIKNLIELIRVDEPTKPIIVVNTIFRSNQNGIGNQGNTDGYVAQSAYKFNEDKKVILLAKAVDELCGNMANVYLCPVGFTHDSKYNFGNNKVQVNPRLSNTDDVFELMPSDSVHPQTPGYMQMADEIFSTLCAVFNS